MKPVSAKRPDPELQEMPDEQLVGVLVAGNKFAFDVLVKRHRARLYSYLLRLLRDPDAAEEVAQETFIRAYVHADKYRNIAKYTTWLYTIATNLVRNRIRKTRTGPRFFSIFARRQTEEGEGEPIDIEDRSDWPDRTLEKQELHQLVEAAVERIPARYRDVFVLREMHHHTYEEIASMTGLKLGTVRSRINRGRRHFRKIIAPLLEMEGIEV